MVGACRNAMQMAAASIIWGDTWREDPVKEERGIAWRRTAHEVLPIPVSNEPIPYSQLRAIDQDWCGEPERSTEGLKVLVLETGNATAIGQSRVICSRRPWHSQGSLKAVAVVKQAA